MDHSQHGTAKPQENDQVVYGWANASTPAGNKALQYSDLKSLEPQKDTREASSELVVRLGGTMERYIWTINGKKFSDAEPLKVKYGERIRIKFINRQYDGAPNAFTRHVYAVGEWSRVGRYAK